MLFKNLNNYTLEERVLYIQEKTKEITEWITIHGGNSEDIHKMIEEQIQKIISDNNLSNEEIIARLDNIDDEIATINAMINELDSSYKAADEAIKNSFNSQISGLRTESQSYTNTAVANALQEANDYTDSRIGNGEGTVLYEHNIAANISTNVGGYFTTVRFKIISTNPNVYIDYMSICQEKISICGYQYVGGGPYSTLFFTGINLKQIKGWYLPIGSSNIAEFTYDLSTIIQDTVRKL